MSPLGFDPKLVSIHLADVAAREILPRFQRLERGDWREKSPGDIVTVSDEMAEAALAPLLTSLVPNSILVGEESAARDPSIMSRLSEDHPVWIVDPIDGTANYAAGGPDFCVMVALSKKDRLLASWIHVPVTGLQAFAVAGEGAWIDGRRLSAAGLVPPSPLSGVIAVGHRGGPDLLQRAQTLRQSVQRVKSLRCAGLDYLRLARGEIDFALFSGVMPWDHAPGIAFVRELGGEAGYASGRAYLPSGAASANGVLTARSGDIWRTVLDRLNSANVEN